MISYAAPADDHDSSRTGVLKCIDFPTVDFGSPDEGPPVRLRESILKSTLTWKWYSNWSIRIRKERDKVVSE